MFVVIVRVSVLDQTKRCCPLDHGTVISSYCKAPIAKRQSSSMVQVAFPWYFVENIFFINGVTFDLRVSVDISFLNTYVNGDLCSEDGQSVCDNKIVVYSATVAKIS